MEKNKKNNLMLFVAVFLLAISLIAFFIALNLDSIISLQKQEIPVNVIISNYSAWNISKNQSDLNLGIINKGSAGVRSINISNDYKFKTVVETEIKGNITPLMIYEPVIILEPMEDREIVFRTKTIENEEFGEYSGIIIIRLKKLVE